MRLCSQAEGLAEWHSNTKGLDLTKDPPQKINKETLTKIRKADRKWCERRKRHQPGTGPAVLRTQHRAQQRDAWTPLYEKPNAALHQPFKCRQRSLIPARSFLFFPTFKQGKRLWKVKLKKDSCLPYFLLLLFLFFFFSFSEGFFLIFLIIIITHKQNCQGRIWMILSELQMKVMGFLKTLFTLLNTGRTERAGQTSSHIKGQLAYPSASASAWQIPCGLVTGPFPCWQWGCSTAQPHTGLQDRSILCPWETYLWKPGGLSFQVSVVLLETGRGREAGHHLDPQK